MDPNAALTGIVAGMLIVILLLVAADVCDINLKWIPLYITSGILGYIAGLLMYKAHRSDDGFVSGGFVSGGRHDKPWKPRDTSQEEKREAQARPRLPFKRAQSLVSPEFRVSEIKHPKGFPMTLIDESPLIGGSKQRALIGFIADISKDELVYAGPATGYAQIAIAYCCLLTGKAARIFVDATDSRAAPLSAIAREFGAIIIYFEGADDRQTSRLKVIQKQAEQYVERNKSAYLLPFGMDSPAVRELYETAFAPLKRYTPTRLWVVAGSGMIFSTLARIWPECELMIIQVGKTVCPDQLENIKHQLFVSPYAFSERIRETPPYNTLMSYDAKVWPFILEHGQAGDYVWNTAGEPMAMDVVRAHVGRTNLLLGKAREEEAKLVADAKLMTMPMFHDAMAPPREMFESLRKLAASHRSGEIVSRNFTRDYAVVDGLSNHFTEEVRMDCIVNRSDKISPKGYWKKYQESIAREAYWLAGPKPTALEWRDAMNASKCYECGTFNPMILVNAIKRYFTEPIAILDPSSGWGDRLIGALACDVSLYVGFDPNRWLAPCYARIKAELAPAAKTVFIASKYSNKDLPADTLEKFDLAFTSPPFFDEEIYVGTEQDVKGSYDQWLKAMYEPYLQDMVKAIKPDGIIAVYIDNVPRVANMANDTTRILRAAGMGSLETLLFRNDTTGINGLTHHGHPRSLWVFKREITSGGEPVEQDTKSEPSPYPAIVPYETTLDDEVTRLRAVDEMLDFVTHAIKRATVSGKSSSGKKIEYETRNIVERLLLACANYAAVNKSDDPVFVMNDTIADNFKSDVGYKYPDVSLTEQDALVDGVAGIIAIFEQRDRDKKHNARVGISYRNSLATINIGAYKREIAASRMRMLVTRANESAVIKMFARYATIISGSQHWEAPLHYFKVLYALGVRFEGFSSPINSQFIREEFPDARICTLFPDTDAPFGSIGGFFQVDFLSYWRPDFVPQIVVGPPYYDELILQIAKRVIDHCDRAIAQKKQIRFVITHSNSWDFSQGFGLLNASKYKRIDHVYPSGDHFYQNDRGEQVVARFSTRMFMLDAGMPEHTKEYEKTLLTMFPKP
jgi:hypothetical protein